MLTETKQPHLNGKDGAHGRLVYNTHTHTHTHTHTPPTTWLRVFTAAPVTRCSRHLPAGEMKLPESYAEL